MTNTRRVVVTGIGLVSSLGIGTDANWAALSAGKSGVETITKFDAAQFATQIAGEVRGFDPLQFIEKKDVKKMDVFITRSSPPARSASSTSGMSMVIPYLFDGFPSCFRAFVAIRSGR
jgi:3-oxoacyl-[acyl-carrier-protein] synthase II